MSTRERFRELIARGRLVPMPGAYDALSAKIMEAEGFEAIIAGGYAAIGSMMGQADMGQCNVRDYAAHYARICAAVKVLFGRRGSPRPISISTRPSRRTREHTASVSFWKLNWRCAISSPFAARAISR